jgi:hypothetical protein
MLGQGSFTPELPEWNLVTPQDRNQFTTRSHLRSIDHARTADKTRHVEVGVNR